MTDPIAINYADGDVALQGVLALPEGDGPHPAVLVMHDALGLGELVRERAVKLASLGYVALASDMYGAGKLLPQQEVGAHMEPLMADASRIRARAGAALKVLAERPEVDRSRIAAIGFCFGGHCVLELARDGADLRAVVSYHGLLTTRKSAEPGAVKGEIVIFTGAKDPYAPLDHVETLREELTAAGAKWQLTIFGEGYHAFTDPRVVDAVDLPGIAYDPLLDAISWSSTLALLDATLH